MWNLGQAVTRPPGMPGRVLILAVGADIQGCFSGFSRRTNDVSSHSSWELTSQASLWWSVVREGKEESTT